MVWGLSDQALSSATNFALSIFVARSATGSEFGSFAIVIATYFVVAGVSQGLVTQPLAVVHSASSGPPYVDAMKSATGAALLLGLVTGAICVLISFGVAGSLHPQLLILGLTLPGLLLQDAWRFAFVAGGRPAKAALNDAVWALIQVVGFVAVEVHNLRSPLGFIVVWGLAACVAAVFGVLQAGRFPALHRSIHWLRAHHDLGAPFAVESLVIRGSVQLGLVSIAAIGGLAAAGAVRGAQVVFSPLNLAFLGALFVAVPEGARTLRSSRTAFDILIKATSSACALAAILWGAVVLAVPQDLGRQFLGSTWDAARPLLWLVGGQILATGTTIGPQVALKAAAAAARSLTCQIVNAVLLLGGCSLGVWMSGAEGAAAGILVATVLGAVVWWRALVTIRLEPAPLAVAAAGHDS